MLSCLDDDTGCVVDFLSVLDLIINTREVCKESRVNISRVFKKRMIVAMRVCQVNRDLAIQRTI